MKSPLCPLFAPLAVVAFTGGCQSSSSTLHPPAAELRARLGRVAIVALTNSPHVRVQIPDSRTDVLAERESFELVTPRMVANRIGPVHDRAAAMIVGAVALATPLVVMGGAPLWQELRRTYGLIVADDAAAVTAARNAMGAAVSGIGFEQQLRARLLADLAQHAPQVARVSAARWADTVLEIMVYEPSLSGREGINPGLGLCLGLRVRLLDARTRRELYYDYLDYGGPKHTFVRWAADDARLFHEELARCLTQLSAEIVAQLFTRPPEEMARRDELASVGIERRATEPSAPPQGWAAAPLSLFPLFARR